MRQGPRSDSSARCCPAVATFTARSLAAITAAVVSWAMAARRSAAPRSATPRGRRNPGPRSASAPRTPRPEPRRYGAFFDTRLAQLAPVGATWPPTAWLSPQADTLGSMSSPRAAPSSTRTESPPRGYRPAR